eukprot:10583854-Ditylum_brightwellii.AAC.1
MASVAEAELGALFENAKEVVSLRTTLIELGHQQPATPIQLDNSTAQGFLLFKVSLVSNKAQVVAIVVMLPVNQPPFLTLEGMMKAVFLTTPIADGG